MSFDPWHEEPISRKHNREAFDCGEIELNTYLLRHARKNHEQGGSKTWIATPDGDTVYGYYTLSPAQVAYHRVPDVLVRNSGKYDFPAFRLGRLAVDRSCQGNGLGGALLAASARRCIRAAAEVGGTALLIDAKNERVANWYERFGAIPLLDTPLSLLLPLAGIARELGD
jgi:predicted N-acetyltransferase YhbS